MTCRRAARASGVRPRIVLELVTSMLRHGFTAPGLREAGKALTGCRLEGVALHLPLAADQLPEVERLMTDIVAAGRRQARPPGRAAHRLRLAPLRHRAHRRALDVARLHLPAAGRHRRCGSATAARSTYARPCSTPTRSTAASASATGSARHHARARCSSSPEVPRTASGWRRPTGDARSARGPGRSPGAVSTPQGWCARRTRWTGSSASSPSHRTCRRRCCSCPPGATVPEVGDEVPVRVRYTATAFDQVKIS